MAKRIFYCSLFTLLMGLICANAQDAKTDEHSSEKSKPSKFEQFISRTDALIVSKGFSIGRIEASGGTEVSVKVAWELGKDERLYAASISYATVDFEQLQEMQDAINRMVKAVNTEFDRLEAGTMTLSTKSGLSMSYYAFKDSLGTPKRNLYLKINDKFITQGPAIEPLVKLGTLVGQAREKLIALGAK